MMDKKDVTVLFDGSFEGFLCVVYAYYYDGINPLAIQKEMDFQPTIDSFEYNVCTDINKALRVQAGICKKISKDACHNLACAFLADYRYRRMACDDSVYMDMFRYVLLGFKIGAMVDSSLQHSYVLCVHKLCCAVTKEAHLLTGFSRFAQTKDGVYYCEIKPVHQVLTILAEHFKDRMMNQMWVIHDKKHGMAAIYDGNECRILAVPKSASVEYSDEEEGVQALWKGFLNALSIENRRNERLQRGLLPLRFRGFMTEF